MVRQLGFVLESDDVTLGAALLWFVTCAGGCAAAGSIRVALRLEERLAIGVVAGIVGGSCLTLALGLTFGLNPATALLGPMLLGALAALLSAGLGSGGHVIEPWRQSWRDAVVRWERRRSDVVATLIVVGISAGLGAVLLSRAFIESGSGSIGAGYNTVWADWSLHSTIASSFVHGAQLPGMPHDPIFSGGTLRYPFLPDFHSAAMETMGASVGTALGDPIVVLGTAITVLVVSLARRLGAGVAVGGLAMVLFLVGGGLGFTGVTWDACRAAQADGTLTGRCDGGALVGDPLHVLPAIVGHIPSVVSSMDTAPGRSYDNLEPATGQDLGNVQWYTPLLAWWLPQRTFVYGFAVTMCVLLLVVAGMRSPPGTRTPFVAAGLMAGTLPVVHVHSLIALAVVLPLLALRGRRREWWWLVGACTFLALPRLLQVAAGGHGVATICDGVNTGAGTEYPYLEPGWKWNVGAFVTGGPGDCSVTGQFSATPLGVIRAVPSIVGAAVNPGWWGFWIMNAGIAVPVCAVVASATVLRHFPYSVRARNIANRVYTAVPRDLLQFCLPFVALFVVANVVVFQTWDWDNTKLLAYWYFGAGLLLAALLVRLATAGWWRAAIGAAALTSLVLSSGLALGRIVEQDIRQPGIPYVWASQADVAFAADVRVATPAASVILTHGGPTDPITTLAGRTAFLGYNGWLYSYGVDYAAREGDRSAIFAGCPTASPPGGTGIPAAACAVPHLLRTDHIDFVAVTPSDPGAPWFAQTYPRVAAAEDSSVIVYDVRSR